MGSLNIGDIVTRKSYNGDVYFRIVDIKQSRDAEPVYVLKGLLYRLKADSRASDLLKHDSSEVTNHIKRGISECERNSTVRPVFHRVPLFRKYRARVSRILHLDSDSEYLDICLKHYAKFNLRAVGKLADESEQPYFIRNLLEANNPDLLVITGHDSMKKGTGDVNSLNNYSNSKYFVQSVHEARQYQPDFDKLCIFAGACQSNYEAIIDAGANFASSPGRVLINVLDPALVSEKVALTDHRILLTPRQIAKITVTGKDGIGGINTYGHLYN